MYILVFSLDWSPKLRTLTQIEISPQIGGIILTLSLVYGWGGGGQSEALSSLYKSTNKLLPRKGEGECILYNSHVHNTTYSPQTNSPSIMFLNQHRQHLLCLHSLIPNKDFFHTSVDFITYK